jgi:hypothetical protein
LWPDGDLDYPDLAEDIAIEARLALQLTEELKDLDERTALLLRAADPAGGPDSLTCRATSTAPPSRPNTLARSSPNATQCRKTCAPDGARRRKNGPAKQGVARRSINRSVRPQRYDHHSGLTSLRNSTAPATARLPSATRSARSHTKGPGLSARRPTARSRGSTPLCSTNGPYATVYQSEAERVAAFQGWLHQYSHHRGHTLLHGQTPTSRTGVTNVFG